MQVTQVINHSLQVFSACIKDLEEVASWSHKLEDTQEDTSVCIDSVFVGIQS